MANFSPLKLHQGTHFRASYLGISDLDEEAILSIYDTLYLIHVEKSKKFAIFNGTVVMNAC
jgi:hypothetical protein